MASAVFSHFDAPAGGTWSLGKRLVNALVASRAAKADRELRRHEALIREAALVHGVLPRVGIDRANLLPFNN